MVNLRRENAELKKVVAEQAEVILSLCSRIAQIEKTSRNSSKPPSSDIVKPQPGGKESPRKIGAQPRYQPRADASLWIKISNWAIFLFVILLFFLSVFEFYHFKGFIDD